jgi:hypothetical protein
LLEGDSSADGEAGGQWRSTDVKMKPTEKAIVPIMEKVIAPLMEKPVDN